MRKVRLDIDALEVESFSVAAPRSVGTVVARQATNFLEPCQRLFPFTTNVGDTWQGTCVMDGCADASAYCPGGGNYSWSCMYPDACGAASLPNCEGGTNYSEGQIRESACCESKLVCQG